MTPLNSAIYQGNVVHRRFQVADHAFNYPIYFLGLDLDEVETIAEQFRFFSVNRFNLLNFKRSDYFGDPEQPLKDAVLDKVSELGGDPARIERVVFLGHARSLGFYFSPVNFYFCMTGDEAVYMVAEVSNTPWNESHCYLVDLDTPGTNPKQFHVSPFMGMDMHYQWKIAYQQDHIVVHIENWNEDKLFEATLALRHQELTPGNLTKTLKQWPSMSLSILKGIYWQATRLAAKRVPFYSHP